MSEDDKIKFTPEQTTTNTEKYKTITTGTRVGTAEPQANPTESLREEMKQKMSTSTIPELSNSLSDPRFKALSFGIIGTGAAGNRIAEQFNQFGYKVCAINTSKQDLYGINLPESQKLLLDYTHGGAGKDQSLGEEATREFEPEIKALFEATFGSDDLDQIDSILICTSLGGGTGGGSIIPLIEILSDYGITANVLCALPLHSEGTVTKANAIKSLDKLSKLSTGKIINSLIVIDNSRIETLYQDISLGGFFKTANFDIVNTWNTFNTLSALPSDVAIDPTDFVRILSSGSCTIFGKLEVPLHIENQQVHIDEDDLAEMLLQNLNGSLLADGFDLTEAVRAGVYITGNSEHLNQIPASAFNYLFASLNEELRSADLFKGVYTDSRQSNSLTIYTLVSGLGLPRERIEQLMIQSQQEVEEMEEKESNASARMEVFQKSTNVEQDRYQKKKKNNSTFGKMVRRRKGRN